MNIKDSQEDGFSLIMKGCKLMGWVVSFPDSESNEDDREMDHLVIGEENIVQSLITESAELYTIVVPPR
jgi:hypothetical protein